MTSGIDGRRARILAALAAILILAAPSAAIGARAADIDDGPGDDVVAGVVVVKFRPGVLPGAGKTGVASIDAALGAFGVYAVEPAFPFVASAAGRGAAGKSGRAGAALAALGRTHLVRYRGDAAPSAVAAALADDPAVAYAEPLYKHTIHELPGSFVPAPPGARAAAPNDPRYPDFQAYLRRVGLEEAWDAVRGSDGDVIIAVVDGGTEWRHVDLEPNVWVNEGEVDNGRDDDGNGYADDLYGWNFPDASGDPTGLPATPGNARHGTLVAGVAAAATDNALGVAGASWNARVMAINAGCPDADDDLKICYGYQGIAYAAVNGADVVNASWGGGNRSSLGEDVVRTATELGTLVITSAGNGGDDSRGDNNDLIPQYPANYDRVLSIGATRRDDDGVTTFSNYGRTVDIFAPGEAIYATVPGGEYGSSQGTSFSSPMVAGIAGLIATRHPEWTPDQIREQLRVSAEPIDDANPTRRGLLGRGRVDAARAVLADDLPSIFVSGADYETSDGDGEIESGETVTVNVAFSNVLAPVNNVAVTLSTEDPNVEMLDGTGTIPTLGTGDTVRVAFSFRVRPETPSQYILRFVATATAGALEQTDVVDLLANPPLVATLDTRAVRLSLTAEGNLGFTDTAGGDSFGEGFVFGGVNHLFEGGLMVATSSLRVSDSVRGSDGSTQDNDFEAVPGENLRLIQPGAVAPLEGVVMLTDAPAPQSIGIRVLQETFADTAAARRFGVVQQYRIRNTTGARIDNLYAGLFFDWDIEANGGAGQNYARWDAERRLGTVMDNPTSPTVVVGTQMLATGAGELSYRAVDNPAEIYDGFSASEKYSFMRGGVQTTVLNAVDVAQVMATGPISIKPGCEATIAFGLVAGANRDEAAAHADAIHAFWSEDIAPLTPNRPPRLPDPGAPAVEAGRELVLDLAATDPDDCDVLRYTLVEGPGTAVVDRATGRFAYLPPVTASGEQTVAVAVTDGRAADTTRFFVNVIPTNQPPVFSRTLADTTIVAGQTLAFAFAADDVEGDDLTFRLENAPAGAAIDAATGVLTWTPGPEQVGTISFLVTVDDGGPVVETTLRVTVEPAAFALDVPYPNPGAGPFTVAFTMPRAGEVSVRVYDVLGREVAVLADGTHGPGPHTLRWDGRAPGGVYFLRLAAETDDGEAFRALRRIVVAR